MPALTDIGTLIAQSPGVCGGRPRIAGTGVSVRRIVGWYKLGWSPEEIADRPDTSRWPRSTRRWRTTMPTRVDGSRDRRRRSGI